jgi:hypothetical protein
MRNSDPAIQRLEAVSSRAMQITNQLNELAIKILKQRAKDLFPEAALVRLVCIESTLEVYCVIDADGDADVTDETGERFDELNEIVSYLAPAYDLAMQDDDTLDIDL